MDGNRFDYFSPLFDDYDPNADWSHSEPIYHRQIIILRRLTSLPKEHLLNLTSQEAAVFINAVGKKKIQDSWDWLIRTKRAKRNMAQAALSAALSSQGVSGGTQVVSSQITL